MPNLLAFNPAQYVGFILIFTRILGVFLSAPVLGDNNIPAQVKVAFAFIASLVFFPVVQLPNVGTNPDLLRVVLLMAGELGVGLILGFSARILFAAVTLAGEIAGFQMGLAMANIFDPSSQQQISLLGQVQVIFALMIFVALDGHHLFIQALAASYQQIQPGGFAIGAAMYEHLLKLSAGLFLLGLRIGAPLIVALMAANFSIGLIARSVPQVNVFIVGLPFTLALGLLVLALAFPFFVEAVIALHDQVADVLLNGLLSNG